MKNSTLGFCHTTLFGASLFDVAKYHNFRSNLKAYCMFWTWILKEDACFWHVDLQKSQNFKKIWTFFFKQKNWKQHILETFGIENLTIFGPWDRDEKTSTHRFCFTFWLCRLFRLLLWRFRLRLRPQLRPPVWSAGSGFIALSFLVPLANEKVTGPKLTVL